MNETNQDYKKSFFELKDKLWDIIAVIERFNGRCPLKVKKEIEEYLEDITPKRKIMFEDYNPNSEICWSEKTVSEKDLKENAKQSVMDTFGLSFLTTGENNENEN